MRSHAMSIVSRVQMSGGDRIIVSPVARNIMPLAIAWSRTTTAALPEGSKRSFVALSLTISMAPIRPNERTSPTSG